MQTLPVVVVFLADARCSTDLVHRLELDNYHAIQAGSSDELYELLNRERVDLVIIQNRLRGFLTGLEILERLYNDLLRPATLLLVEDSSEIQRRSKKLGINRVLPPQSTVEQVAEAVQSLLKRGALSELRISPVARRLVREIDCVRPLPQLLVKLSAALRDNEVSPDELARDISVDTRVTAELLRLSNSSALGRAHKTTNLTDAVNFLGVKRTVSLVLSAGLLKAQAGLLGPLSQPTRTWYNYRSVLTGSVASSFAHHLEIISSETAYILGLLQDVGILVLANAYGERYLGLLSRARDIPLLRLEHLEHEDFQTTHSEVSAALLQKWGLPESLVSLVLHHHDEGSGELSELENAFLRVMRIGEAVANLADRRSSQRFMALNRQITHYGIERADECRISMSEGIARMVESSQLFNVPLPSDEILAELLSEIEAHSRYDQADPSAENPQPAVNRPASAASLPAENNEEEPIDRESTPRHKMLIIEDEPQVIDLISHFVAPLGYEVLSCDGLADARRLAEQVDIIFCDVHLRFGNGVDVVRHLRKKGHRGPIVMVSGDRCRETIRQSIAAGINGYLIKPFSEELFLEKLRQHMPYGLARKAYAHACAAEVH